MFFAGAPPPPPPPQPAPLPPQLQQLEQQQQQQHHHHHHQQHLAHHAAAKRLLRGLQPADYACNDHRCCAERRCAGRGAGWGELLCEGQGRTGGEHPLARLLDAALVLAAQPRLNLASPPPPLPPSCFAPAA